MLVFFAHLFAPSNSLEQGNQQLQVPSELYGPIIAFLMKYCLAGELYSHLFGEICVCILPCQLFPLQSCLLIFFLNFLNLNLVIVAEIMSLNRVHHYALKYLHFNCSGVI